MRLPTRRDFLISGVNAASASVVGSRAGCLLLGKQRQTRTREWICLFDGKTLRGWHTNPQPVEHGTGGRWAVEDGTLTGEQDPPGSGNGGILLTDQEFSDFELSIDIKPDWGVDTGLFLRCNEKGQCFQIMVDYHDNGNIGQVTGMTGQGARDFNTRTFEINGQFDGEGNLFGLTTAKHKSAASVGLAYSCAPEEWVEAWRLEDWNTLRVRLEGKFPHITTWINGLRVCVFDGETSNNKNYRKEELFSILGAKGSIAVQVYAGSYCPKGSKCRWKNIKIRHV
jgi:hypothetical protein